MKRLINFFFVFCVAILMQSCGKFSDGTSVWQGGLWLLPTVTLTASLFFLGLAYFASRSGSWWWQNHRIKESKENIPIIKVPFFIFFIVLLIATIVIAIVVNSER